MIPPVEHPVWGCDPSTRRIALGIVLPGSKFLTRTLELGPGVVDAPKLAMARLSMLGWFESLAYEYDPGFLWVEQPFSHSNAVHPSSWFMTGTVIEAAYTATGAVANMLSPTGWKCEAMGQGNGFARKRAILDWARGLGFEGDCDRCEPDGKCKGSPAHDAADALGVAVAGARFVAATLSAVQSKVDTDAA